MTAAEAKFYRDGHCLGSPRALFDRKDSQGKFVLSCLASLVLGHKYFVGASKRSGLYVNHNWPFGVSL